MAWIIEAGELADSLKVDKVTLLNDLEAIGYGLVQLEEKDFPNVNEGSPSAVGNLTIIAAGTGLGQAACYWNGIRLYLFAFEGGHVDFARQNLLEVEPLNYLLTKFER